MVAEELASAYDQMQSPRIKAWGATRTVSQAGSAPAKKAPRDRALDVLDHLAHPAAQRPPGRRIGVDRRSDRDVDPAERPQHVGASDRDRADRDACLEREVADADFERADRPTARVAALRKHEHDPATRQHLVDGPESSLIKVALVRRDREHTDQRHEPSLPASVEYGLALGHGVNHRSPWEERDDECRVEPRLMVRGDDVWRRRNVF